VLLSFFLFRFPFFCPLFSPLVVVPFEKKYKKGREKKQKSKKKPFFGTLLVSLQKKERENNYDGK